MAATKGEVIKYRQPSEKTIQKAARALLAKSKGRAKGALLGMDIGTSMKGAFFAFLGVLAAQFAAKKFADGGGATEDWTWKNYLIAPVAGLTVAFVVSTIMGGKTKHAQWILIGSMAYTMWQFFRSEVVEGNSTLEEYFAGVGEYDSAESPYPEVDGADWDDANDGDIAVGEDGRRYVMRNGAWLPAADEHRVPTQMGNDVTNVPASMGDDITNVPASMGDLGTKVYQEFLEADKAA